MHEDFLNGLDVERIAQVPFVQDMKEKFKLADFSLDWRKGDIGFGGVFKKGNSKDGFTEFSVKMPQVEQTVKDEKCENCRGTGKDSFPFHGKCLYCGGMGENKTIVWADVYGISASFRLFGLSWPPDKDTSATRPQLLVIRTITQEGIHGGAISGEISIPLTNWMKAIGKDGDVEILEAVQAMKTAYKEMFRSHGLDRFMFRVTESGGFISDCPGNACGLHPHSWYELEKEAHGYHFSSHNVDMATQQLTLLVGLAALCDKARKEMKV